MENSRRNLFATPRKEDGEEQPPTTPAFASPVTKTAGFKRALSFDFFTGDIKKLKAEFAENQTLAVEDPGILDLKDLSISCFRKQAVEVRVTALKLYNYNKQGSEGIVAKFVVKDKSGEMQFTAFDQIWTNVVDIIKPNASIRMYGFKVEEEDTRYPTHCDFKMIGKLNKTTKVEECTGVAPLDFNFEKVDDISKKKAGTMVDLLVVVHGNLGLEQGPMACSRRLICVDKDLKAIQVTLWREEAKSFGEKEQLVLAIRHAVVEIFDDVVALKSSGRTLLMENYEDERATTLLSHYQEQLKIKEENAKREAALVEELLDDIGSEDFSQPMEYNE